MSVPTWPDETAEGLFCRMQVMKCSHTFFSGSVLGIERVSVARFCGVNQPCSSAKSPQCLVSGAAGFISSKMRVPWSPTTHSRRCLSGLAQHR